MSAPPGRPSTPKKRYVDLPNSRFYFDSKFFIAVILALVTIILPVITDSAGVSGKLSTSIGGILGVVIGLLLQPKPKTEDYMPKARSAIQSSIESIESIQNVSQVGAQLVETDELYRIRLGLAGMDGELKRAIEKIQLSMAEWDHVSPGVVEEFKTYRKRGHEMLRELQAEEDDE